MLQIYFHFNGSEIAIHSLCSRFMFRNAMLLVQQRCVTTQKMGCEVNSETFHASACRPAPDTEVSHHMRKKRWYPGQRICRLQFSISSQRVGRCGSKRTATSHPLCKKLSVSWMRAVQNIRLFQDKEDFRGSARKGLREWGNSAVKCFAVYKKLLATEEGDFLVQKMLFRQHQPPSISSQMPCYQTNRRLAEMPKF